MRELPSLRPIFTIEKTKQLVDRGFICYGVELNREDPTKLVFLFERGKEISKALDEIKVNERTQRKERKRAYKEARETE